MFCWRPGGGCVRLPLHLDAQNPADRRSVPGFAATQTYNPPGDARFYTGTGRCMFAGRRNAL